MTAPFDATPVLRAHAARRLAQLRGLNPVAAQKRTLLGLLRRAARTRFGRAHGFSSIDSVAEFQRRVPLRTYEQFWAEWWQPHYPVLRDITWPGHIPYFALSSGTTSGRTKYLPVTNAMLRSNRGAALDVLCWELAARPQAPLLDGVSFLLGGSTALERPAPGVRQGDLSGIATREIPPWARPWSFPPAELALMADWDRKLDALVRAVPAERVRVLTGTPSWLLLLLERLAARHGAVPLPRLELLIHGGIAWAPYRNRIAPFLPRGCGTREVFPASEGFFAMADRGDGEGMRLVLDRGLFFEFVPVAELGTENPARHWLGTLEYGVEYALVVSTCAGLWGYVVGDTVRFLGRDPPRLLVTGRTSYSLSAFGEHLGGEEIDREVSEALRRAGLALAEYCVGPVFAGATGHHLFLVETAAPADPAAAPALAGTIDRALHDANADYAAHRDAGQLGAPELRLLTPGAFAEWMRATGKLGGQHKVPRVLADPERFAAAARWLERTAA